MYYVVQFRETEATVRGVHVGSDSADVHCEYLSERWPGAYFDVLSEVEMDKQHYINC